MRDCRPREEPPVRAWIRICRAFPQTRFWGYTRSWAVPELAGDLAELRDLENVQIFASTDPDMPLPPKGWRCAFVVSDWPRLADSGTHRG